MKVTGALDWIDVKEKLFHIGQEVTPNRDCGDYKAMFGKIFTVHEYAWFPPLNAWGIRLKECPYINRVPHYYDQEAFSPVLSSDKLEESLLETLRPTNLKA